MRDAIARAPVGDDQYGEDPTTNRLQDRIAKIAVTHLDVTHEQCERAAHVLWSASPDPERLRQVPQTLTTA